MRASSFRSLLILSFLALITRGITYTQIPNAQDELQIRNKLSLYSLAVDYKQFDLIDQIFTQDVEANYSLSTGVTPTHLVGIEALRAYLIKSVEGQVTQHTISSTVVELDVPATAGGAQPAVPPVPVDRSQGRLATFKSTSYLVANIFGQGDLSGKFTAIYGTYYDTWVQEGGGNLKIGARTLTAFAPPIFFQTAPGPPAPGRL